MDKLIEPSYITFGTLFKNNTAFFIPNYQRNYAWTETKAQQFWDDIFYCASQRQKNQPYRHFFGQILCFSRGKNSNDLERFELIDGQQRITTFTLLCVCMAEKCKIIASNSSSRKLTKIAMDFHKKICENILFYTVFQPPVQRLHLQQKDMLFLQALISAHINNSADCTNPITTSQKLLKANLTLFINNIDALKLTDEQQLNFFSSTFQSLHEDCILIELAVKSHIGVQHLFTTVNDRGLCLTTGELLKAKVMESFKDHLAYQAQSEEIWNTILADDVATAETCLEYYFISNCGRIDSNKNLYHHYLEKLLILCNERTLNQSQADSLMEQIRQLDSGIKIIAELLKGQWPYPIQQNSPCLWQRNRLKVLVNGLGCKSVIPLLLSAKTYLTEELFYKVLSIAELNYFNVISVNSPNRYTKYTDIVYKESLEVRRHQSTYKLRSIKDNFQTLRTRYNYDTNFENTLRSMEYKPNASNSISRYFLYMMEIYYNSFNSTGYIKPDDSLALDFDSLSTEHIYSLKLAEGNKDINLERYKNNIGNLCPLGKQYNSRIGNKTFIEKLPKYQAAGYKITLDIGRKTCWTKDDFDSLTNKYILIARKLFIENAGID